MSCPVKYREIGDFHAYYSGTTKAPYLTMFVGGNHEASSHLWELFYGGWVAPNIYYMGAANVVRLGGVRITGMSGIWKGYNFNKPHHERLPYNDDDIKSIYHIREIDTRKLLQLRTQVDIGISHDWPRAIEKLGDERALFRMKPDFEQESRDGTLGNQAAAYVMDRLRPPYWFAAHMHCRFASTKVYDEAPESKAAPIVSASPKQKSTDVLDEATIAHNADEIDLDMDDDESPAAQAPPINGASLPAKQVEISLNDQEPVPPPVESSVPSDLRAQLPAAFSRPAASSQRIQPGQPFPPEVTNKVVRFLALDKCLPGRKFLQLLEISPYTSSENGLTPVMPKSRPKPRFEYDPEWLAITRVFASDIVLGDKNGKASDDQGEAHYRPLIEIEQTWVNENIVEKGKLEIPENFVLTAPTFEVGMPEIVDEGPLEYNNPQMEQFCDLVGIENKFFATEEEREQRMKDGPAPSEQRHGGFSGRARGGHRGGNHGGGRGRGRGGGRGGHGGQRGRGGGRGRGGW
jgi:lariat debranching enzyme